jgi:hypothetical protein
MIGSVAGVILVDRALMYALIAKNFFGVLTFILHAVKYTTSIFRVQNEIRDQTPMKDEEEWYEEWDEEELSDDEAEEELSDDEWSDENSSGGSLSTGLVSMVQPFKTALTQRYGLEVCVRGMLPGETPPIQLKYMLLNLTRFLKSDTSIDEKTLYLCQHDIPALAAQQASAIEAQQASAIEARDLSRAEM